MLTSIIPALPATEITLVLNFGLKIHMRFQQFIKIDSDPENIFFLKAIKASSLDFYS